MAKMNVENKVFQLPIDVTENGIVKKVLATADTYLDKNIEVTVNTPDAEFEVKNAAAVTATVTNKDTTFTTDTETPYAIEIAADAHADAVTTGVKTAGFAAATDTVTVAAANATQDTKTIYVKEGHLSGSGEASATSTSVKMTKGGAGDFQITATAAGGAEVDVAGWLPVGASADASGDATYAIQAATLANTAADESKYEEKEAPVLTEDGFLFINEGYIKDTKISLATLVPDDANITSENADKVYNTVKAYDVNGKLIVGTMGDAELSAITADDAEANISSVSVAAQDGVFHVTGTGAISGSASVAVSKRGLAETTLAQTGTIEGEAALDATIAKVGLAVEMDDDVEVTPVIAKEDATTAKTGAITKVQPTGRYIAVSTAAIEASATATPTVATEGYGTADLHDATGATVKAGAAGSGTYYIPVEAGSHTAVAADPSIVNASATVSTDVEATDGFEGDLVAGVLTTAPADGEYITITADATPVKGSVSGTVTCTAVEGYIESGAETKAVSGEVAVEVTAAAAKYIRVYDGALLEQR